MVERDIEACELFVEVHRSIADTLRTKARELVELSEPAADARTGPPLDALIEMTEKLACLHEKLADLQDTDMGVIDHRPKLPAPPM
jgi:hypothetical protein